MMMVRRLGQAQHWGLLLYLMTIILSYHQHQQVSKTNRPIRGQYPGHVICLDQSEACIQVSKTNRPSKLRSALTEHQRDFYINTGLMMPHREVSLTKSCGIDMSSSRSDALISDHYQDLAIAK